MLFIAAMSDPVAIIGVSRVGVVLSYLLDAGATTSAALREATQQKDVSNVLRGLCWVGIARRELADGVYAYSLTEGGKLLADELKQTEGSHFHLR